MARKRPRVSGSHSAVPLAESVCFEVRLNGKRVRRAGFTGYGILDASLTWLRHHPHRGPDDADTLSLHVGGVDHTEPAWNHQLLWEVPAVRVGDRIEIRVTEGRHVDTASASSRVRVLPRLEPPPVGDPARTDVGGATMWLGRRGLCLRTRGPTILSRAEAKRLADALKAAADGLAQPPRRNSAARRNRAGRSI